jgi:hypothetical protein
MLNMPPNLLLVCLHKYKVLPTKVNVIGANCDAVGNQTRVERCLASFTCPSDYSRPASGINERLLVHGTDVYAISVLFTAVGTAFHCLCQACGSIKASAAAEVKVQGTMIVDSRANRPENPLSVRLFFTAAEAQTPQSVSAQDHKAWLRTPTQKRSPSVVAGEVED